MNDFYYQNKDKALSDLKLFSKMNCYDDALLVLHNDNSSSNYSIERYSKYLVSEAQNIVAFALNGTIFSKK